MLEKVKRGISRLIDSYQEGLIEKAEFEPRIRSAKQRLQRLESELKQRQNVEEREAALRLVVGRMRDFADKVTDSIERADWSTQRAIICAVVKRVEIDEEDVRVVYKVAPTATQTPQNEGLQHCLDRAYGPAVQSSSRRQSGWNYRDGKQFLSCELMSPGIKCTGNE